MGYWKTLGGEAATASANPPKPRTVSFVAALGKHLHAETDAENRCLLTNNTFLKRGSKASLTKLPHAGVKMAYARQEKRVRAAELLDAVRNHESTRPDPFEHVDHRANIADPVVDHGESGFAIRNLSFRRRRQRHILVEIGTREFFCQLQAVPES